jgi:Asp-tRNA(Asn)/Glu-tRNA(Gln) amidotransferase A subunit family amidase
MPTGYNSPIYSRNPPALVDAAPIITLRASGAVIFGKTATTEFAAHTIGGPCRNPHDQRRTPGGSSSGSGAVVADNQVPIALGTQTGGSTIRPGSFNGVYAFKVTPLPLRVSFALGSAKGLADFSFIDRIANMGRHLS